MSAILSPSDFAQGDFHLATSGDFETAIDTFFVPDPLNTDAGLEFAAGALTVPGYVGTALHKSTDGTRVINYAHWQSQADFDAFLKTHGRDFAQFAQNASRIDPHTYDVVYLDEPGEG